MIVPCVEMRMAQFLQKGFGNMKKIYSVLILFAIMIEALAPAAFAENAVNIYVSPAGNALASGSLSDPVNSIASAAEAAKRYSGSNDSIPLSEFKADRKYSAALLRSFADSASSARIDAAPAAQR